MTNKIDAVLEQMEKECSDQIIDDFGPVRLADLQALISCARVTAQVECFEPRWDGQGFIVCADRNMGLCECCAALKQLEACGDE